jgi:transcription initiation factor IIE alpha subunit
MQHDVIILMGKTRNKAVTSGQLANQLQVPKRDVRMALYRLWKCKMVERKSYVNTQKHIEYKYKLTQKVRL